MEVVIRHFKAAGVALIAGVVAVVAIIAAIAAIVSLVWFGINQTQTLIGIILFTIGIIGAQDSYEGAKKGDVGSCTNFICCGLLMLFVLGAGAASWYFQLNP